ncbi:exodeoxyribonuclease VII small subunit [Aerococcus christensenii]|uniref:exodeoxyribonuclease VII small subunit n=1 Tax=Aerococcus christensenii TaxID=87541 RepID=UPI0023A964EF|nr:exodeoxyribonuclease VII small subunit [Aerococcus christensenii]WEB70385.1 exodeoxyribonuclease VII small subunit [Aerococcus christensenii]
MTEKEELSFEEALNELEAIVSQLQNGDIPLKESMEAFQKGIQLSNYCSQTLEQAEKTMTKLMNESGDLEDFEISHGEED